MIRKSYRQNQAIIITARKAKGTENWFVGGITDENKRDYTVDFSFLDKGKKYEATIYEDGKDADYINNPQSYHIYKQTITGKSRISLKWLEAVDLQSVYGRRIKDLFKFRIGI